MCCPALHIHFIHNTIMRKRITTVLIAFLAIVMCATVQAQNPTSGTAGTLTWKYDTGTKTLTISGKGEITEKAP